ncbi:MAG TPA: hypothetical protein IAB09_05415 [Candidatus Avilachnospira avicola]|nr:hypothetical protein [Candidatus Avilachnospira avicola]
MERTHKDGMTVASLIMSGITVIFGSNLLAACLAGGLGMTFALLSRGEGKMSLAARIAFIICIIGVIASIIITVYMAIALINSGAMEYYMHILEDELRGYGI